MDSPFVIAEWTSYTSALPAVDRALKSTLGSLDLIEFFSISQTSHIAIFKTEKGFGNSIRDHFGSTDLVDSAVLESPMAFEVIRASYGLGSNQLREGHSLAVVSTTSIPLGFLLALKLAEDLGPESLLELKIGRGLGGGLRATFGAEKVPLEMSLGQIGSDSSYGVTLLHFPHPQIRSLFSLNLS